MEVDVPSTVVGLLQYVNSFIVTLEKKTLWNPVKGVYIIKPKT